MYIKAAQWKKINVKKMSLKCYHGDKIHIKHIHERGLYYGRFDNLLYVIIKYRNVKKAVPTLNTCRS